MKVLVIKYKEGLNTHRPIESIEEARELGKEMAQKTIKKLTPIWERIVKDFPK